MRSCLIDISDLDIQQIVDKQCARTRTKNGANCDRRGLPFVAEIERETNKSQLQAKERKPE